MKPFGLPRADALKPVARWSPDRKRDLVSYVERGDVALDAALTAHGISIEEFTRWRELVRTEGRAGLKATRQWHLREAGGVRR